MRLIGWPLSLFLAAQFAVFALLDFGTGEHARLVAIGLQAVLLFVFVIWRFGSPSKDWTKREAYASALLLGLGALSLVAIDMPGFQISIMIALLYVADIAAGRESEETWPPEPDPPADAIWPMPSPAWTGAFAFLGGILVSLPPSLETVFYFSLFYAALMVFRGFAVTRHVHWRPMPIWRPGLLRLYGPIACYGVFLFGLEGDPTLHRSLIALLFPFLLLALSNLGENLGRRWMARRGRA